MKSTVCTLFEGNYHYGVASLTNSLYRNGFRGVIWAGFRGELPFWAKPIRQKKNYQEFVVAEKCVIRFVKLDTNYHFANFKPNFMLKLWTDFCPEAEELFYFDPDIVVKCRWSYFEKWANFGVALCEDVNSPIPDSHPLRFGWRKFFQPYNYHFNFKSDLYMNSGFVGVAKRDIDFLKNWMQIQERLAEEIGGLEKANPNFQKANPSQLSSTDHVGVDQSDIFNIADQDALNFTLMTTNIQVSLMGKEGMDIEPGGFTMSHALGSVKPWRKKLFLSMIIKAKRPNFADKGYLHYCQSPIKLYSRYKYFEKKVDLFCANFFGRFVA